MTAHATITARNRRMERDYSFPSAVSREEAADFIARRRAPAFRRVAQWYPLPPDVLWAQLEDRGGGVSAVRVDFCEDTP